MRELLLHTIVLVPTGTVDNSIMIDCNDKKKVVTQATVDKGNYFQLCGPPLTDVYLPLQSRNITNEVKRKFVNLSGISEKCLSKEMRCNKKRKMANKDVPNHGKIVGKKKTEERHWNPHDVIPRHRIFYSNSYVKKVGFPPNHILNQQETQDSSLCNNKIEEKLLSNIFSLSTPSSYIREKKKRKRSLKRIQKLGLKICKQIINRHKRCDYARLLHHHCPLPDDNHKYNTLQKSGSTDMALCEVTADCQEHQKRALVFYSGCYLRTEQVSSFVKAVFSFIFPIQFWGSSHNFNSALETISVFISMRRHEQIPIKSIVHGIKVLDMRWLFHSVTDNVETCKVPKHRSHSDHSTATTLMRSQLWWVYCSFLIPLLRSVFYITESEETNQRVLYYRKPVWSKLRSLALNNLLHEQYKQLHLKEAIVHLNTCKLGISSLRLLPKKTGIRPVATMRRPQRVTFYESKVTGIIKNVSTSCHGRSMNITSESDLNVRLAQEKCGTNFILKQTFDILKFEHEREPEKFGAGIMGLNHLYPLLLKFVKDMKQPKNELEDPVCCDAPDKLFFASVDIHHCYDNIKQDFLYDIIDTVLLENEYLIQKCTVIHPSQRGDRLMLNKIKNVGIPENFEQVPMVGNDVVRKFSNSLIVDGITHPMTTKRAVLDILKDHLFSNVVVVNDNFGPTFLLQRNGIPQGR